MKNNMGDGRPGSWDGARGRAIGMKDTEASFDISQICEDFRSASKDGVIAKKTGERVTPEIVGVLRRVGEGGGEMADDEQFFKLGRILQRFEAVMEDCKNLPPEQVKDLSALVKWCKEFFLQGNFLEAASKTDFTAARINFAVNQLCKIKQTTSDDPDYFGPGKSVEAFDLTEPRMRELLREVDVFSESFLTEEGLGKQLHKGKGKQKTGLGDEELFDKLKVASVNAKERAVQLGLEDWKDRGVEGLYALKNAITVAHFFSRGHNLVDLEKVTGKEKIKARLRESGQLPSGARLMYYYDFGKAEFGVHLEGSPIPTEAGRSRGDQIVHYDPDTIFYVGLIVEYFKNKKSK